MKTIYSGLESSGKSLRLAKVVTDLVARNSKWNKSRMDSYERDLESWERSLSLRGIDKKERDVFLRDNPQPEKPEPRPIVSNLQFKTHFEEYAKEMGVPIIYWTNLDEIIKYDNADVIIDEVGTYFDSRLWSDLSLDVRRWLTQGAKTGIEIYGSAQDFAQVDLAFRRLVNNLYHITKLVGSPRPSATRPPVKRIWGICMMRELNAREYKEDKKSFDKTQLIPSVFFIERIYCEIFDTTQKILRSTPPLMKHVDRYCESKTCGFHKTIHV